MTDIVKRTTVNYNLRIPVFDAPGWGREMERNFDILDATIFAATGLGSILGLWTNATVYVIGDRVADSDGRLWVNNVNHTSPSNGSFDEARTNNPTYWTQITETTAFRGDWASGVTYNINDFIVDTYRYGIAINKFTSTVSYDADVLAGNITTLIDLVPYYNLMTQYVAAAELSEQNASTYAGNALGSANASANSASDAYDYAVLAEGYKNTALSTYADLAGGTSGQVLLKQSATDFDFHWANLTGGGDMLRATYDPTNVGASAFLMANMTEGANAKIMTSAERTKLSGIETAADVTDAGNVSPIITGLAVKASIADADYLVTTDSAASNAPKRNLFSVVKATLKTYFDTLYVPVARTISAGTGLSGGGALSANRSLAVVYGSTAGTSAQGNDARITGAAQKVDLASTAGGKGASTIGVQDSAGNFTGTTVETVLAELQGLDIGVGQTWSEVTASRSKGTAYQNTTGKSIMVTINLSDASAGSVLVSEDNTTWVTIANSRSGGVGVPAAFIVPTNWWYKTSGTPVRWAELR